MCNMFGCTRVDNPSIITNYSTCHVCHNGFLSLSPEQVQEAFVLFLRHAGYGTWSDFCFNLSKSGRRLWFVFLSFSRPPLRVPDYFKAPFFVMSISSTMITVFNFII
ncbi:hypothetical protein Hanom_Chr08g00758331 [Helianthus anomalus]